MVDPINFTNYNRTDIELEEAILFGLLVANKNAATTARLLDTFLKDHAHRGATPFIIFRTMDLELISNRLKQYRFGCYNNKAKGIYQLARSGINLRTCTTDDLEAIHGIGRKTSRLFILHTRPDARCIPLDTHILHYLRDIGYIVPVSTPSSKSKYETIERLCIQLSRKANKSCADWDLDIWREYSSKAMNKAS